MFYGNPATSTDQSTPKAVWDINFTGVYHMAAITTTSVADSTSAANNAVLNSQIISVASGEIGPSAAFPGATTGAHFELPAAVLNANQGTMSVWINTNQAAVNGQNWVTAGQVDSSNAFNFGYWTSYFNATIFGWVNQSNDYRVQVTNTGLPIPVNTWQHLVYTWNKTTNTQVVYANGAPVKTVSTSFTPYTAVNNLWIGEVATNQSYGFGGFMDELRISNIPRSASWIATEFANQSAPGTFYALGAEASN
jgi:hypothetical protein